MVSKKSVIILGTGSSRVQCPYDTEVWGVNGIYSEIELRKMRGLPVRLDKLFVTDYLFSPQGHLHFDIDRVNRLRKEFGFKVVSLHRLRLRQYEIPTVLYPFRRIAEKFKTEYFTSTICYMLAYALDKGFSNLRLYGIDMHGAGHGIHGTDEYKLQKGGVEFWLGLAMGLGCEVFVAPGGAIMATPNGLPYGFRPKIDLKMIDPFNLLGWKKK